MLDNSHTLIDARDLWLRRGERELFSGLSLSIAPTGLIWLRGANGRGKTTLLRILAGFITPEQGQLSWRQQAFSERHEEDRQAISFLDERLGLARDLTVNQNLKFSAHLAGQNNVDAILRQLNLEPLADRPVGQLSTGQKKRCAMARLLTESAHLWLLDEPANGLDTDNRILLCRLVEQHLAQGGACLYTSHDQLPFQQPPQELVLDAI